jgi:hypothetical protein
MIGRVRLSRIRLWTAIAVAASGALTQTPACADADYRVVEPAYFAEPFARLEAELRRRDAPIPGPSDCTGFPNQPADAREGMVHCIRDAACWSVSIVANQGAMTVYSFAAPRGLKAPPAGACRADETASAEAAFVSAFVRCDSDEGRRFSIDLLLSRPIDGSTSAKAEAFKAQAAADPGFLDSFQIKNLCHAMLGYRAISQIDGGFRDEIWLAALKPIASPDP